jgi:NAD(P)-dependent dehydrogenase (short-subunit alcohol dehydrogenase family)
MTLLHIIDHHHSTPPTMASTALIIGASQGLGASLVRHYAQKLSPSNVFATIRESAPKSDDLFPKGVNVIPNIDVSKKDCGDKVVDGLQGRAVDHVWIVAGLLKGEVSQIGTPRPSEPSGLLCPICERLSPTSPMPCTGFS